MCAVYCGFWQVVAGATIAGLSNKAELLGAMHISRLLMRSGVSGLASTELKVCYLD